MSYLHNFHATNPQGGPVLDRLPAPASYRSTSSIAAEQTFSGTGTFLRMPRAPTAAGTSFAVIGVPFDLATSNRPGSRFGPQAIRAASAVLADLKAYPGGFDPLQEVATADLGDVYIDCGKPLTIPGAIESAAAEAVAGGAFLCALGGDHFVSYPLIRAQATKHGRLALIHFDAHTDTWPSTAALDEPPELNHGTMFHRAVMEGVVDPARSIQIGIRTWVDDPLGITILDNEAADELSPRAIAAEIRRVTAGGPAYLTIDIDCLDPAFAPGTGTPVTGGLTPLKLMQILRALDDVAITGADVVEVAPAYDLANITALNAATIVYELLCRTVRNRGVVQRKHGRPE